MILYFSRFRLFKPDRSDVNCDEIVFRSFLKLKFVNNGMDILHDKRTCEKYHNIFRIDLHQLYHINIPTLSLQRL